MKIPGILIIAAFILSCNSSVSKGVLPPKKMQAVLWDVMQADAMAEYYSATDSSFQHLNKHAVYYQQIFAIHKISKEDFAKSLAWYQDHPASLKPILDSLQSFVQRQQNADSIINKPEKPILKDTLKQKLPDKTPFKDTIKRKLPVRIRPAPVH